MEVRNFGCLAFWAVLAVRLAEGIPTKLLIYICRYLLYHISYVSFVSGTALVLRRLTLVGDVFSSMCTAAVRCWLLGTVDCIVVIRSRVRPTRVRGRGATHQGRGPRITLLRDRPSPRLSQIHGTCMFINMGPWVMVVLFGSYNSQFVDIGLDCLSTRYCRASHQWI